MKITILSSDYKPYSGGIAELIFVLCNVLARKHENTVNVITNVNRKNFDDKEYKFDVQRFYIPSLNIWIKYFSKIRLFCFLIKILHYFIFFRKIKAPGNYLKKFAPDIIIVGVANIWSLYALREKTDSRKILLLHGTEIAQIFEMKNQNYLEILNNFDLYIANSNNTKKIAIKYGIAPSKIVVIHPHLNIEEYVDENKNLNREKCFLNHSNFIDYKYILTISRLVERKGIDQAIKAFSKIVDFYPNVKYLIAGEGEQENSLKQIIKNLKLTEKVLLLGRVSEHEKKNLLQHCEFFILPCRELGHDVEGFGIVFLEAAIYGKPVIAGDTGGVRDAVVDNQTGLLVDPDDIHEISNKLKLLIDDNELKNSLGEAAVARVIRYFSSEAYMRKLNGIIKCILQEN